MDEAPALHVVPYASANPLQRLMRRLASSRATAAGTALYSFSDRRVFRLTHGRHTLSSLVTGLPVILLTSTGARSGQPRTNPVLGFPTDGGLAVIASNYGRPRDPAWCHNVRAHPEAEVDVGARHWRARAVECSGERRERVWREGLEIYPAWSTYERRAVDRRIPVFVLEPLDR